MVNHTPQAKSLGDYECICKVKKSQQREQDMRQEFYMENQSEKDHVKEEENY